MLSKHDRNNVTVPPSFQASKQGWTVDTALGAKSKATEIRRCAILNASRRGIQMK